MVGKDGRWAFQACDDILSPLPHFKVGSWLEVGQLLLNLAQKPHGCKTSFVPGAFPGAKCRKWDKLGYKVKVVFTKVKIALYQVDTLGPWTLVLGLIEIVILAH